MDNTNADEMNYSPVNFTTPETFGNFTTESVTLTDILLPCMLSINVLFGVPANIFIICLIIKGTKSGVSAEFINLNLSVCEIVNSLKNLITLFQGYFSSAIIIVLSFTLLGVIFTGRPLFQCLMCVERYLAVVHPVTFLKFKPLRYRVICCAVVWLITLGACLYYIYISITSVGSGCAWLLMTELLLFLSIQLFCLVAVLRALKQSGPGERTRKKEENPMKRRAFFIILITSFSMVIAYVPNIILELISISTQLDSVELLLTASFCCVLASFVHPVLYLQQTIKCFK